MRLPTQQNGAPCEAATKGCQQNQIALFQQTLPVYFVHGDWNRRSRGVPVFMYIDKGLLFAQTDALGSCFQNPAVGLMRNEYPDIFYGNVIGLDRLQRNLCQ